VSEFLPLQVGSICNYTTNSDPNDPTKEWTISAPAQCGFNYVNEAFCNKGKGD